MDKDAYIPPFMINFSAQTRIAFSQTDNQEPLEALQADIRPDSNRHSRVRSLIAAVSLSALTGLSTVCLNSFSPLLPALAQSLPTLSAGSTGETVSQLQATLKLLGFYTGTVSGTYDESTASAVAQFQTAAGILADGVAGPSTWQKLLPTPNDVTAVSSSAPVVAPDATSTLPTPTSPVAATTSAQPKEPLGPPVLRIEAEGPAVAQLQRELQALGYYSGDIDGGFGEQTHVAVEEFQADQQLFVDGVVGAATWDALSSALDKL